MYRKLYDFFVSLIRCTAIYGEDLIKGLLGKNSKMLGNLPNAYKGTRWKSFHFLAKFNFLK